jgi:exopolyphosphatase / guanosine-5'-triphosphate,3'-diphosphate pyrophosphatase
VPALSASDLALVADQLGREPQTSFEVVARCPGGHPLVIRNHPIDHRGDPFPTLYWLTCPEAVKAVSRLESEGWIRALDDRAREERSFAEALEEAHREAAVERGRLHPGAEAWGGVAGTRRGLKCLHAHYANHLGGGRDPVGGWVAERVEPVHGQLPRARVAAVDMGTNSIRLLVADPLDGDLTEVARDMVITRLGTGVDRNGRFDPDAVERTLDVLARYVRRARALGAERIRVGATSAVRDVADRERLLAEVERIAGTPPEVLTGDREGELTFLGATRGLDAPGPVLVFDIGGGSTELILGDGGPQAVISVDVGSVRATERVGPADPPTEEDLDRLREVASVGLAPAEEPIPPGRAATLLGVAGTTTTVAALALDLPRYDSEAIHGSVLRRGDAQRVAEDLAAMTVAERAALPVMAAGREDVIVAGALILLEIMDRWRFEACLVSEHDILEGLAVEMMQAGGTG